MTLASGAALAEGSHETSSEDAPAAERSAARSPAPNDGASTDAAPAVAPARSALPLRFDIGGWWAWVYYAASASASYAISPWVDVFASASARGVFALSPYAVRDIGTGVRVYPFEGMSAGTPVYLALGAAYRALEVADDRIYETGSAFADTRYTGRDVVWTTGIGIGSCHSHFCIRFEPISLQFRIAMIGEPGVNQPGVPVRSDRLEDRTNWNFASQLALGVAF